MAGSVSYYDGINPTPVRHVSWKDVLKEIRDGTHKAAIERVRKIKDPDQYRRAKTKLPAVTFSGVFNGTRNIDSILHSTGFIIPDLDHLQDVDRIFESLCQDEKIWFAFRSPSGSGIKCGLRADGIKSDKVHKYLYRAVERYFQDIYGITIDPACKDISRLTFLSYDKQAYINPSPVLFNVAQWVKRNPIRPAGVDHKKYDTALLTGKEKYATKVLESCCDTIRRSVKGTQHCVRLSMARLVGGYLKYLDEGLALSELEVAVKESGAENIRAAMKTIQDGLSYGKSQPITIEDLPSNKPFYSNIFASNDSRDSRNSRNSRDSQDSQPPYSVSVLNSKDSRDSRRLTPTHETHGENDPPHDTRVGFDLTGLIRQFCKDNQGATFTTSDIDREFGIHHPRDKDLRRYALARARKEKIILKDKIRTGVYNIPKSDIEFIDLSTTDTSGFQISLPFGLSEMVNIPKRSIIVIAGTQNAGKTALSLNIIKDNLSHTTPLLYLMSEMGPSEYKKRVEQMGVNMNRWQEKVKAADVPTGFGTVIDAHNPDGLTVVDYLEDRDGEYFRIASDIRNIYDSLNTGVAIVCLQKHSVAAVGRGGEATTEKARLYLTLDTLAHQPNYTISALKIIKAKDYPEDNPNGKELHIKIIRGHTIETMEGFDYWQYCNQVQRSQYLKRYEHMMVRGLERLPPQEKQGIAKFHTVDGPVFLNQKDFDFWCEIYHEINVAAEVRKLEDWTAQNPTKWTKKGWFFAAATALRKKQEKVRDSR